MFPSLSHYPEPPYNPDGLRSNEDWARAVSERYFADAGFAPERPFFIVRRSLEYHANTACARFVPNLWVERECYLGILGNSDCYCAQGSLVVPAAQFVRLRNRGSEPMRTHEPLVLSKSAFDRTPYRSPMRDPQTGREVRAFSVATDLRRMEMLALEEGVAMEYLEAAHLLTLPVVWEEMQATQRERNAEILGELLYVHERRREPELPDWKRADLMRALLRKARALGMEEDYAPIAVNGIRYRPAEVLEDLARRYPAAAAP